MRKLNLYVNLQNLKCKFCQKLNFASCPLMMMSIAKISQKLHYVDLKYIASNQKLIKNKYGQHGY